MRKRIIIGLAAVVMGGVMAFIFSQPQEDSVEWHKREYLKLREGSRFFDMLRQAWSKIDRRAAEPSQERIDRMGRHYDALMKLGYLEERVFVVSNRPAEAVVNTLCHGYAGYRAELWEFGKLTDMGTNSITLTAPRDQMSMWEEMIREGDVSENGK